MATSSSSTRTATTRAKKPPAMAGPNFRLMTLSKVRSASPMETTYPSSPAARLLQQPAKAAGQPRGAGPQHLQPFNGVDQAGKPWSGAEARAGPGQALHAGEHLGEHVVSEGQGSAVRAARFLLGDEGGEVDRPALRRPSGRGRAPAGDHGSGLRGEWLSFRRRADAVLRQSCPGRSSSFRRCHSPADEVVASQLGPAARVSWPVSPCPRIRDQSRPRIEAGTAGPQRSRDTSLFLADRHRWSYAPVTAIGR